MSITVISYTIIAVIMSTITILTECHTLGFLVVFQSIDNKLEYLIR